MSRPEDNPARGGRLLDAGEAAARLNVPVSWVRAETRAGRLPAISLGRYWRYSHDELEAWLQTQARGPWRDHGEPSTTTRGQAE